MFSVHLRKWPVQAQQWVIIKTQRTLSKRLPHHREYCHSLGPPAPLKIPPLPKESTLRGDRGKTWEGEKLGPEPLDLRDIHESLPSLYSLDSSTPLIQMHWGTRVGKYSARKGRAIFFTCKFKLHILCHRGRPLGSVNIKPHLLVLLKIL